MIKNEENEDSGGELYLSCFPVYDKALIHRLILGGQKNRRTKTSIASTVIEGLASK